jgi:cytochrome c-type biogenesis protein CcmH/NrfG
MAPLLETLRAPARRLPLNRLVALVAVWIALAGGALLVAHALDSPSGASAPDEAQPAAPGPVAAAPDPTTASLPPFAMVLDHRLPAGVAGLNPARQAQKLQAMAMASRDPERFVELGSVLQEVGDLPSAEFSYRSALKLDPGNLAAMVGVAVVRGGAGPAGLEAADRQLGALAATHPRDQLVRFNQAWVSVYRGRVPEAVARLKTTIALGPRTRLGRTATGLTEALAKIRLGANP